MLSLFRRQPRRSAGKFDTPIEAPGLIYAVGDIHGRDDLARRLTDQIMDEAGGRDTTIVFMGDYIDRGEHTRETLDFLIDFAERTAVETVFLMGNHEQMLLRCLRDPRTAGAWLRYGGLQTVMSYGVGREGRLEDPGAARQLRADLGEALGGHLGFLEGLRLSHRIGNLFFAHAGADPAQPIDEQEIRALLWGSADFLSAPRSDGNWVVHGHYIVERGTAEHGRIAVDTGAYASHRLTAARIESGRVTFLQT